MIRTTYPDRICYHPKCDVHECRIAWRHISSWGIRMEWSRIAWRRMSSWGIRMELSRMGPYTLYTQTVPLAQHSSFHTGKNSIRLTFHLIWISHIRMGKEDVPCTDILHPDVSRAPTFYIRISHSRMGEEDVLNSSNIHVRIF